MVRVILLLVFVVAHCNAWYTPLQLGRSTTSVLRMARTSTTSTTSRALPCACMMCAEANNTESALSVDTEDSADSANSAESALADRSAPVESVASMASTSSTSSAAAAISKDLAWRAEEDWALLDSTPEFTVGRGNQVATFWHALAASTPELSGRTAGDCERRWAQLAAEGAELPIIAGPQPTVLEEWRRLEDGRFTGRLAGARSSVWLNVAMEGRLAADPRNQPGYIEAVGGRIYELSGSSQGQTGDLELPSPSTLPKAAPWMPGFVSAVNGPVQLTAAALFAGAIGFGAGTIGTPPPPPPPPPPPTKVIFLGSPARRSAASVDVRQEASLTVGEQRERAALRLERDEKRIEMLKLKLLEDQQRLSELQRVEVERGAGAEAVKLVFPPAS